MSAAFLLTLVLSFHAAAPAVAARTGLQLSACNHLDETVSVALLFHRDGTWTSLGWYNVLPGRCIALGPPIDEGAFWGEFGYFAYDHSGMRWGGGTPGTVETLTACVQFGVRAFALPDALLTGNETCAKGAAVRFGAVVDTAITGYTYTLTFGQR